MLSIFTTPGPIIILTAIVECLIIGIASIIFAFHERKPNIKDYPIYTNGEVFKIKDSNGLVADEIYTTLKEAIKVRDKHFNIILNLWKVKHKKWIKLSNYKEIQRFLKDHPAHLESL